MTAPESDPDPLAGMSRDELMSAFFANLVFQQTNLALMMLGKVAHPESGERHHDLEAAQMLIGQLEMLEHKTRGNLEAQETKLLKESLTALRMAFVEAVEHPAKPDSGAPKSEPKPGSPAGPEPASPAGTEESPAAEESRKKFTKKY